MIAAAVAVAEPDDVVARASPAVSNRDGAIEALAGEVEGRPADRARHRLGPARVLARMFVVHLILRSGVVCILRVQPPRGARLTPLGRKGAWLSQKWSPESAHIAPEIGLDDRWLLFRLARAEGTSGRVLSVASAP